jgi:hypothetical protein
MQGKTMIYVHCIGYNLLPTYAAGIIRSDILFIVHKTKYKTPYSKPIVSKPHIIHAVQ